MRNHFWWNPFWEAVAAILSKKHFTVWPPPLALTIYCSIEKAAYMIVIFLANFFLLLMRATRGEYWRNMVQWQSKYLGVEFKSFSEFISPFFRWMQNKNCALNTVFLTWCSKALHCLILTWPRVAVQPPQENPKIKITSIYLTNLWF